MSIDQLSKVHGNAVTVRGLSPELKARLRVRAAHNARSMEAEARAILEAALSTPTTRAPTSAPSRAASSPRSAASTWNCRPAQLDS